MAYETLINSIIIKPAHKPNYTPTKTLKKALKFVRKLFASNAPRHEKLLNESILDTSIAATVPVVPAAMIQPSDEECENFANERREAAIIFNSC